MRISDTARARLEYLRGELQAERISYAELAELQGLLEAAGVPEFQGGETLERLVITVDTSNDSFQGDGFYSEIERIFSDLCERVNPEKRSSEEHAIHDCNGNHVGTVRWEASP